MRMPRGAGPVSPAETALAVSSVTRAPDVAVAAAVSVAAGVAAVPVAVVVAPRLVVDEPAPVVAQGRGVLVVVPHVVAAVLVDVRAAVTADAGVVADSATAVQADVVEGVGVAVLVGQCPAAQVHRRYGLGGPGMAKPPAGFPRGGRLVPSVCRVQGRRRRTVGVLGRWTTPV